MEWKNTSSVMKVWQLGNFFYRKHIPVLPNIFFWINRICFSCEIPCSTRIGKNVIFAHNALGVVINCNAEIGDRTKILQNVTIGGRGNHGVPKIGCDVLIGANSVIMGGITIGNGAKIGAMSCVLKDVPAGAVVVGNPMNIIKK